MSPVYGSVFVDGVVVPAVRARLQGLSVSNKFFADENLVPEDRRILLAPVRFSLVYYFILSVGCGKVGFY